MSFMACEPWIGSTGGATRVKPGVKRQRNSGNTIEKWKSPVRAAERRTSAEAEFNPFAPSEKWSSPLPVARLPGSCNVMHENAACDMRGESARDWPHPW